MPGDRGFGVGDRRAFAASAVNAQRFSPDARVAVGHVVGLATPDAAALVGYDPFVDIDVPGAQSQANPPAALPGGTSTFERKLPRSDARIEVALV